MTSVRRALALSFLERYMLIVLALGSSMLLARLLTPEQIGIYSVTVAVVGIAQVLRDFGIGNFLIQERSLTDAHVRTAFGLALLLGGGLFIVAFLVAPWAGRFYNDNRMVDTLRISSLNFLVLPFCSISLSLLRRDMQFQRLLYVTVAAGVVGTLVTSGLAFAGWGPNGLAAGSVIGNLATGIGAWIARGRKRILPPGLSEWRRVMRFGGQSAATNVVTSISMDINDLALGKLLGFAPVAMISRAQGLMNLFHRDFMGAVRNVAFPAFANAHRNGESLESRHTTSVTAVTAFAWPFYGFVALFPLEIIRLMFGVQWDAASELVPIFCLAGAVAATASLALNVLLAIGRIDLVTKAELIFQPFRALLIVAAAAAYRSLLACALAYLLAFLIHAPFAYYIKQQGLRTEVKALLLGLWQSIKVTLLCLAVPFAVSYHAGLGRGSPVQLPIFLLAAGTGAVGWLIALMATRHPVSLDPMFPRLLTKLTRTGKAAK